MTEKLYYIDSHMREFRASVLACEPDKKGYLIVLDRTAFFPEGGGQCADTGYLDGAEVLDVQEKDGVIYHSTKEAIAPGTAVVGRLDWEQRFSNMQQHSGEHIVSGLIHGTFGYDNVGFHLGKENVTMDFNGTFTEAELLDIERRANAVVFDNREIKAEFPDPETLKVLDYRSKLELTGDVRIVTIPGTDTCACCAPHVTRTGEIGLIKIVDVQNYKGGTRMWILCGDRALADYRRRQENIRTISVALSAKREQAAEAVIRQKEELSAMKETYVRVMKELIGLRAAKVEREESICLFEDGMDAKAMRELVNLLVEKTGKMAAVFSGSTGEGFHYIIGSRHLDMRQAAKEMNAALNGRGGGTAQMAQGTIFAQRKEIEEFVDGI